MENKFWYLYIFFIEFGNHIYSIFVKYLFSAYSKIYLNYVIWYYNVEIYWTHNVDKVSDFIALLINLQGTTNKYLCIGT